jgi:hypothetical protein
MRVHTGKDTESKMIQTRSGVEESRKREWWAQIEDRTALKSLLVGDYEIKDRTDRVGKVELLSKTGRWAMQLEVELLTGLQSQSPAMLAVGAGSRRVVLEAERSSVAAGRRGLAGRD